MARIHHVKKSAKEHTCSGHDAKWLSVQVACVTEGGQDRAEIRDYMRGRSASDALIAKFETRVGL